MATHLAAMATAKGEAFEIRSRTTPKPGPGELLIQVKSVAFNPADHIMRDLGLFIPKYPTVIGFDIAGLVLEIGEDVPTGTAAGDSGPSFEPGVSRVAAYAAAAFKSCDPDYGAFQERCLVPWQHAAPIPAEGLSWNQAATLPVAVQVPLSVWDALSIPRAGDDNAAPARTKREALLIWGASSSVGSMGVQTASLMRKDENSPFAAVYATAGAANQKYVESLGADRVFDYKDPQVVEKVISAAKEDGIAIRHCFLAMGSAPQCQAVLKAFVDVAETGEKAKIGSAPPLPADLETVDGVDTLFVQPAMADEGQRLAQFRYWMGTWLREKLAQSLIRPSPELTVVGKGLESINVGLNQLQKGVSCTKLVVEVEK